MQKKRKFASQKKHKYFILPINPELGGHPVMNKRKDKVKKGNNSAKENNKRNIE